MENDELLIEPHVDSINQCLLCVGLLEDSRYTVAMHLVFAAEHVLCQSSLNSSLRHCSSTGCLSNQQTDCTLGLNHSLRRAKGREQAWLQTWRLRDSYM